MVVQGLELERGGMTTDEGHSTGNVGGESVDSLGSGDGRGLEVLSKYRESDVTWEADL